MKENGHDCLSGDFFYFFYFSKESVQKCSQLEHKVFVEVIAYDFILGAN